jgi:hypothetical protein
MLRLLLRHFQTLTLPDPLEALVVHVSALPTQQRRDPRRPIPPVYRRQLHDPTRQRVLIITLDRRVPLHRSGLPEHPARPTLAHADPPCRRMLPAASCGWCLHHATPSPAGRDLDRVATLRLGSLGSSKHAAEPSSTSRSARDAASCSMRTARTRPRAMLREISSCRSSDVIASALRRLSSLARGMVRSKATRVHRGPVAGDQRRGTPTMPHRRGNGANTRGCLSPAQPRNHKAGCFRNRLGNGEREVV